MSIAKELLHKVATALEGNSKGQTLVEALIALTILAIIAVPFLASITTGYTAVIIADERTTAESLTRSELEYIEGSVYCPGGFSYEIPTNPPPWDPSHILDSQFSNYTVKVTGTPIDPDTHDLLPPGQDRGIQQITVEVYHRDKLVFTTSSYKLSQ